MLRKKLPFLIGATLLISLFSASALLLPAQDQLMRAQKALTSVNLQGQLAQVSGGTSASAGNRACVLSYITSLPNRSPAEGRAISGQFVGWPWRENFWQIEEVHRITGEWVGVIDLDFTSSVGGFNWNATFPKIIDYWNSGGLISIGVHWMNPHPNGGNSIRTTPDTIPNIANILIPGTVEYTKFKKEADEVATRLAVLRDAGVAVLFVPFNEITVGTPAKWYASRRDDVQGIKNLQIWLKDYYTNVKKLDNLIWIYNATKSGDPLVFYPGNAYYDMATLNVQNQRYCDFDVTGHYSGEYQKVTSTGKPFSFAEGFNFSRCRDPLPLWDWAKGVAGLKAFYPKATYWVAYDTFTDNATGEVHEFSLHHADRNPGGIINDPWTINRDEIDWRSSCSTASTPPPSTTPAPVTGTLCNSYGNTSTPPSAFGASYNLFSSAKELLLSVVCDTSSAAFTVGNGANTTYVWSQAYYTKNGQTWNPITLAGTNTVGNGQWIIGSSNSTQVLTSQEIATQNYLASYVCTYVNNTWKCGCSDSTCATPKWNLQGFRK